MAEHDYGVRILKDSVNIVDDRITTWELTYPRFVHAELMTHRMFSRNAASSRAIPTAKLMERIERSPVMPKWWGKNQSGMQAREELPPDDLNRARELWLFGRDQALAIARELHKVGLHKQIANRVLEPWMFITVIVTATEFDNWFFLRDTWPEGEPPGPAQPELAWVAREMRRARAASTPTLLKPGQWHLPLVELVDASDPLYVAREEAPALMDVVKISAARCARVSYLTHDGARDLSADLQLHDRLSGNGHWSPFEHPAQAMEAHVRSGNFIGWRQYRKFFENEHHGRRLA